MGKLDKVLPLCLLAALAACKPEKTRGPESAAKMERNTQMTQGPFELKDDEFWADPLVNIDKVADANLTASKALVIDGPQAVDLGARQTLPVPLYYQAPQAGFAFEDVAVVVAARQEDRRVLCDKAADRITVPRETPDSPPDESTSFGDSRVLDLKKHPRIPWQPGTWHVNVIIRDLVSNRIRVRLGDSASKFKDPEVEKFLKEQKYPPPAPVSPEPGQPLPTYKLWEKSPAVPDAQGINLYADRVVVTKTGHRAVLSASFRLAPLPGEIVPEASGDGPQAIIPITLVLVGTEKTVPVPFIVRAPARGKPGDKELTGHFAVDLLEIPHLDPKPQTYFVYAFAGEVMAGPAPVGLVAEEMLPGRGR